MAKKFTSLSFKQLQKDWEKKLTQSGFIDIEDSKGNLKNYDRRTAAFDDREATLEFFLKLDRYLQSEAKLTEIDRMALSLYSKGMAPKDVAKNVHRSPWQIHHIIKKHKPAILLS